MEITKIRLQMQALLPAVERQSLLQVVQSLGIRGMYTGTLATLSRDVPFSLLFFPGYANLKKLTADSKTGENSTLSLLFSGGLAGSVAAAAVTPSDVIKTRFTSCCKYHLFAFYLEDCSFRLQVAGGKEKYNNMKNAFFHIFREEGLFALYKGEGTILLVIICFSEWLNLRLLNIIDNNNVRCEKYHNCKQ